MDTCKEIADRFATRKGADLERAKKIPLQQAGHESFLYPHSDADYRSNQLLIRVNAETGHTEALFISLKKSGADRSVKAIREMDYDPASRRFEDSGSQLHDIDQAAYQELLAAAASVLSPAKAAPPAPPPKPAPAPKPAPKPKVTVHLAPAPKVSDEALKDMPLDGLLAGAKIGYDFATRKRAGEGMPVLLKPRSKTQLDWPARAGYIKEKIEAQFPAATIEQKGQFLSIPASQSNSAVIEALQPAWQEQQREFAGGGGKGA